MAKINKVKEEKAEEVKTELSAEDKIRAEAEELDVPKIPNGSWDRIMIYDIRFSDKVLEKAAFDRVAPSLIDGFTLRFAILAYIPPPPAVQKWVTALSVKDPENIHLPEPELNVRTYLVMNNYKLDFANIVRPKTERSAIIAYAKYFENKWNIPILIGIEMLVKFTLKHKGKLTLKDFGLDTQEKLPVHGMGVVFECFKIATQNESKKDGKKYWNTEFTTYDKIKKTDVEGKCILATAAQVDAVYEKMVAIEEEIAAKKKNKDSGDESFNYGANKKDSLDEDDAESAEAVDSLIESSDGLD